MISWKLYLNEWRDKGFYWFLMIAGTLATNLLASLGILPQELFTLPLVLSIFGYAILCGTPLTRERKNNTIYIKKSLPVSGFVHLFIKALWLITSYVLYMTFWYTLNLKTLNAIGLISPLNSGNLLLDLLVLLILPFFGIVSLQFSYLLGYYVPKLRGPFNFWAFILLSYVNLRTIPVLTKLFEFLPDLPVIASPGTSVSSAFLLVLFGISVALLFINGKLWDNEPSI